MVEDGKEYLRHALAGISLWRRHSGYGVIRFNVHTYSDDGELLAKSGYVEVFRPITPDDPLELRVALYSRPGLLPGEVKRARIVVPVDGEPLVEGDWRVPREVLEYVYVRDPITQLLDVFQGVVNYGSSWTMDYWEVPVNGYTLEGFMPIFVGALEDDLVKLIAFEPAFVEWDGVVKDDVSRIHFDHDWGRFHFSVTDDLTINGKHVDLIALAAKFLLHRPGSRLSGVEPKMLI